MCLGFSDWFLTVMLYIFYRVLSNPYSEVLCSEECQKKKLLACCEMFVFFKAIYNLLIIYTRREKLWKIVPKNGIKRLNV